MSLDKVEVIVRLYDKGIAEKITIDGKMTLNQIIAELEKHDLAITGIRIEDERDEKEPL